VPGIIILQFVSEAAGEGWVTGHQWFLVFFFFKWGIPKPWSVVVSILSHALMIGWYWMIRGYLHFRKPPFDDGNILVCVFNKSNMCIFPITRWGSLKSMAALLHMALQESTLGAANQLLCCNVYILIHRTGWWENFNRKALYLMVKTMVSCRFSLKPIHWLIYLVGLCSIYFPSITDFCLARREQRKPLWILWAPGGDLLHTARLQAEHSLIIAWQLV